MPALGVAIGSSLQDMQGFQLIMNFLVMPIFFLSGALFPLDGLPKALAVATMVDPLSYGIDGMRSRFCLDDAHYGAMIDFEVLVVIAAAFIMLRGIPFFEDRDLDHGPTTQRGSS